MRSLKTIKSFNKLLTMKKILFVLLIISAMIFSCKTTKKSSYIKPAEEPQFEMAEHDDINKEADVSAPANDAPITMKTEEVTIAEDEDQSKGGYAFYVIMGSFTKPENAGKFKVQLINQDFSPVMLNTESGFIRVAVEQTNSEADARKFIGNIRNNYPEYKDAWLLKNQ